MGLDRFQSIFLKVAMPLRVLIFCWSALIMGLLSTPENANSVETIKPHLTIEESEQYVNIGAVIAYGFVRAPLGGILLIRRDEDLCAVRFTKFHQGEFKTRTPFRMDGHVVFAEYDWFLPAPGTVDFSDPAGETGHSKLEEHPRIGLGRLSWVPGDYRVECGSFDPFWIYPTGVEVYEEDGRRHPPGLEFAPTSWRNPSEVDLQHPQLKWYGYDESRKTFLIRLNELPGGDSP